MLCPEPPSDSKPVVVVLDTSGGDHDSHCNQSLDIKGEAVQTRKPGNYKGPKVVR